jgi:hypothetical protein
MISPDSKSPSLTVLSPKKVEIDITYAFLEYFTNILPELQKQDLVSLANRLIADTTHLIDYNSVI